mgnify:FL=1
MIKMKNNKVWFILAIIIIICIGIGIYFFSKNKNSNNSTYSASKTSANEETSNNTNYSNTNYSNTNYNNSITNKTENNTNNNFSNTTENNVNEIKQDTPQPKEEQIASFTTKIYNKDTARQTNIELTCSSLNGVIVKNGTTFSFCNTLGPATSDKGYQEADVFDKDGNKQKGLGGGKCQVSTTLYNAVLKVPNLQIIERHEHSNKVPYVSEGKDAAVSYGSYDFKFKNNSGFDIKLSISCSKNDISIILYKI